MMGAGTDRSASMEKTTNLDSRLDDVRLQAGDQKLKEVAGP